MKTSWKRWEMREEDDEKDPGRKERTLAEKGKEEGKIKKRGGVNKEK